MHWPDVTDNGIVYTFRHLDPFDLYAQIGGEDVRIVFTFGFHIFTDEKGNGVTLTHQGETRSFCKQRFQDSFQAVHFLQNRLLDSYTTPYVTKKGRQQFFCLDLYDYALFLTVQKSQDAENELKCRVVSAYSLDQWGKHSIPRGKAVRMRYVLDKKNRGEKI